MNQTLCKNSLVKLSPPSVPQACRHGIGVRTASSLTVHIDPYDSMDDGDLIELFWDGCYVASKILTASDIGTAIALRVPESFLQNGKARTYYRVMKVGECRSRRPAASCGSSSTRPEDGCSDPTRRRIKGWRRFTWRLRCCVEA